MTATPHVCLDTNILFRAVTQGQPGCEMEHVDALRRLVEDRSVVLLNLEIIELEFDKLTRQLEADLTAMTLKLQKALTDSLGKAERWNEMDDMRDQVVTDLMASKDAKLKRAVENEEAIRKLLGHPKAVRLDFTPQIMFQGKRRLISGRIGNPSPNGESDCCIVETLIAYFKDNNLESQLLICSENEKDFGLKVDGTVTLHPTIKDNLPTGQLFNDLASLVTFIKANKPIVEPPAEVVQAAAKEEQTKYAKENLEAKNTIAKLAIRLSDELSPLELGSSSWERITKEVDKWARMAEERRQFEEILSGFDKTAASLHQFDKKYPATKPLNQTPPPSSPPSG